MSIATEQRSEWSDQLARALVEGGYETQANLSPLLAEAKSRNESLAMLLISRGLALPGVVVGALAHLANLPAIDVAAVTPNAEAVAALPLEVAREFEAVPLQFDGNTLAVAFAESPTHEAVDALAARIGCRVAPVLGDPVVINERLQQVPPPPSDGAAPPSPLFDASPPTDDEEELSETERLLRVGLGRPPDASVPLHVDDLLRYAVSVGASDLHLAAGIPGMMRLHGALRPIEGSPVLGNEEIRDMIFGILPASQRERFEAEKELDTSHSIAGVGRFRVNVAMQRGTVAAALRPIPHDMPEFETLGLPEAVRSFTELRRGLVLVTGPTGS